MYEPIPEEFNYPIIKSTFVQRSLHQPRQLIEPLTITEQEPLISNFWNQFFHSSAEHLLNGIRTSRKHTTQLTESEIHQEFNQPHPSTAPSPTEQNRNNFQPNRNHTQPFLNQMGLTSTRRFKPRKLPKQQSHPLFMKRHPPRPSCTVLFPNLTS